MKPDFSNISSVLFVCLGNICRSPLAEGILRTQLHSVGLQDRIRVNSAGTGAWHVGNEPDPRSVAIASHHGIDISSQRSRQIASADFDRHDLILAMDRANLATLKARAPSNAHDKIFLFMDLALGEPIDVPDPYYQDDGFENVYCMLRDGCAALLRELSGFDLSLSAKASSTT